MAVQNVINLWRIEEGNSGFSLYDFSQIKEATQNFSRENKLGQGGFGAVYKVNYILGYLHIELIYFYLYILNDF